MNLIYSSKSLMIEGDDQIRNNKMNNTVICDAYYKEDTTLQ